MTAAAWAGKPTLSHIRAYIKIIDQKKTLSHIRTYIEIIEQKKKVDDGDDAYDDADQHGTAAERRPRQRRGPGGLRIRLCGIIII